MAKRLKKVLLFGIPVVALLCAGAGLVLLGIVKVPGLKLPPKGGKPATPTFAKKEKPKPRPIAPAPAPVAKKKPPAPTTDPELGVKKVAKLWNEMEADQLKEVTSTWTEGELARVLNRMDPEKVSELLGSLPPERASNLSRAIEREASKLPTGTAE